MELTFKMNRWWLVAIILIAIVLLVLNTKIINKQSNFESYLKTEIDSLRRENQKFDSIFVILSKDKNNIRIIRERITIASELEKLERFKKELEAIRGERPIIADSISPKDLEKYFIKEFK